VIFRQFSYYDVVATGCNYCSKSTACQYLSMLLENLCHREAYELLDKDAFLFSKEQEERMYFLARQSYAQFVPP